jgi:hypothetical protein
LSRNADNAWAIAHGTQTEPECTIAAILRYKAQHDSVSFAIEVLPYFATDAPHSRSGET